MLLAVNQYGGKDIIEGKHPRKELLNLYGGSKADRMYRDKADGTPTHIGYVIREFWVELYKMEPWEGEA